uniref:Uncharacterized protein n=1 Tax=Knipowitschia caucasica TaxID=637954 RepID=A0AAV2J0Y1_KNICA
MSAGPPHSPQGDTHNLLELRGGEAPLSPPAPLTLSGERSRLWQGVQLWLMLVISGWFWLVLVSSGWPWLVLGSGAVRECLSRV